MTTLSPESDRTVRQAVDAYLAGAFRPELDGEAQFETRNGRYRLIDGVLFHVGRGAASDAAHVGAELVGWLCEEPGSRHVDAQWRPGARAILVDQRRGHHIVITSSTRNFVYKSRSGMSGSPPYHGGSGAPLPRPGSAPLPSFAAPEPVANETSWLGGALGGDSASPPSPRWIAAVTPATGTMPATPSDPDAAAPSHERFGRAEVDRAAQTAIPGELAARASFTPPPLRPLPYPKPPPRRPEADLARAAAATQTSARVTPPPPLPGPSAGAVKLPPLPAIPPPPRPISASIPSPPRPLSVTSVPPPPRPLSVTSVPPPPRPAAVTPPPLSPHLPMNLIPPQRPSEPLPRAELGPRHAPIAEARRPHEVPDSEARWARASADGSPHDPYPSGEELGSGVNRRVDDAAASSWSRDLSDEPERDGSATTPPPRSSTRRPHGRHVQRGMLLR